MRVKTTFYNFLTFKILAIFRRKTTFLKNRFFLPLFETFNHFFAIFLTQKKFSTIFQQVFNMTFGKFSTVFFLRFIAISKYSISQVILFVKPHYVPSGTFLCPFGNFSMSLQEFFYVPSRISLCPLWNFSMTYAKGFAENSVVSETP